MNCCTLCFLDSRLQGIISSLSTKRGTCDFCGSTKIELIACETLSVYFEPLFELYTSHPSAEGSLKIKEPFLLHQHMKTYWKRLFNKDLLDDKLIKFLVDNIGRGGEIYLEELFEQPVEFSYIVNDLQDDTDNLELKWDSFADDIKYHNRFFLNQKLDTDLLQSIFERLRSSFTAGSEFFRARISEVHLSPEFMGKPPFHSTTAGRANPVGIPYLYLSNDLRTTLYETRISLHETLTVGKFISTETINLISLKNIDSLGPFEIMEKQFSIDEFIEYRPYLQKLESELSKPVRKQDVHLDYLPTQFLCEFFKSMGFDAVEYKSAMNPEGSNLALFDDRKVECVESKFYKVNSLLYNWDEL
ncbi:RES family NAD+ phosphorylase [Mucilaginibacter sp. Mucisp84]|uniref:RES family NAD+ phosphorylase n=1 Tax=Mucilaginibacter sp. Mucisp84 TaxID=3243058 RepID=UPI0039A477B0